MNKNQEIMLKEALKHFIKNDDNTDWERINVLYSTTYGVGVAKIRMNGETNPYLVHIVSDAISKTGYFAEPVNKWKVLFYGYSILTNIFWIILSIYWFMNR